MFSVLFSKIVAVIPGVLITDSEVHVSVGHVQVDSIMNMYNEIHVVNNDNIKSI